MHFCRSRKGQHFGRGGVDDHAAAHFHLTQGKEPGSNAKSQNSGP
jgi:hypothetical protein